MFYILPAYQPLCCADTGIAGELLLNKLRYRTASKIKRLFCRSTPKPSNAHSSPITELPQDVVEIVISHFIYDIHSLLACSLTCHSWYIAAVPHLHHTLTTDNLISPDLRNSWPRPLKRLHKLGLLPLVRQLRIRREICESLTAHPLFNQHTLRYFSMLTNLQELGIDYLNASCPGPTTKQCLGHFSPTLRLLALTQPRGTCWQILYFIGLFPNLQDLKINRLFLRDEENMADATLVPLSIPPLQGWLTLVDVTGKSLVKGMITLFGGLRFRHMDLFQVKCMQLVLHTCAETLETLRLYPTDKYGEGFFEVRRG